MTDKKSNVVCPYTRDVISSKLKEQFNMNELEEQIFDAKKNGLTDQEIGEKYNVNSL